MKGCSGVGHTEVGWVMKGCSGVGHEGVGWVIQGWGGSCWGGWELQGTESRHATGYQI